jgi:uncharacterized protein (TIGR03435 family)
MTSFIFGLLLAAVAFGQTPAFEVATIKPAEALNPAKMVSGTFRIGASIDGARAEFRYMSLADLIQYAYGVKTYQVSGPDWIKSERFDIQAKLPEGATRDQAPQMLQALLSDRFQLKLRREQTEHSVFGLVVAKGGLKLRETTPDPQAPPAAGGDTKAAETAQRFTMTRSADGGGGAGAPVRMSRELGMHIERKMTMAGLADFLSRFVGRPVIDMTETKATYQVAMDLPLGEMMRSAGAVVAVSSHGAPVDPGMVQTDDSGSASVFTEVQKMGLKLEPRKAPVELLAVASAERKPSENWSTETSLHSTACGSRA